MKRDLLALALLVVGIAGGAALSQHSTPSVPLRPPSCDVDTPRDGYELNYIYNDQAQGTYYSFQLGGLSHPLQCVAHMGSVGQRDREVGLSNTVAPAELQQLRSTLKALAFGQMQSAGEVDHRPGPSYSVTVLQDRHTHGIHFSLPPTPEHAALIELMTRPNLPPGRCYRQLLGEYRRRWP